MDGIKKRSRRSETSVAFMRRWEHSDAPYAVVEIESKLGMGKRYVVTRRVPGGEFVVSRHRKKHRAVARANRIANRKG